MPGSGAGKIPPGTLCRECPMPANTVISNRPGRTLTVGKGTDEVRFACPAHVENVAAAWVLELIGYPEPSNA